MCNRGMVFVCVRLRGKEAELTTCEKKLLSAESQVNELQARLNDAVNQRRHWEDEYNVSSLNIHLKGKEVCLYSAILSSISKHSDMDHTVLPANYTMSAFPS